MPGEKLPDTPYNPNHIHKRNSHPETFRFPIHDRYHHDEHMNARNHAPTPLELLAEQGQVKPDMTQTASRHKNNFCGTNLQLNKMNDSNKDYLTIVLQRLLSNR